MSTKSTPSDITRQEIEQLIDKKLNAEISQIVEKKTNEILEAHRVEQQEEPRKGRTLSSYLELVSYFSNNASSISRNLALAGIAIIWIFKKPSENVIPGLFNFSLWCLAISLGIDLLQYLFGSFAWKFFYERKYYLWKRNNYRPEDAKDIEAPNFISIPIDVLFLVKIVFMLIAYCDIIIYLYDKF